jgi:probable F420-dependent oxidoreductase
LIQIGLVYPQIEFGSDPAAIRDYAVQAEALGFTHILAYDHIVGANPNRPGGWTGPYTHESLFMEPLVLFSHMAALTTRIGFVTGIVILPQRQTVLFAKQTAVLDVLCGGRLRVGVGIGWNPVEYEALGEDFHNRGRRIEEQVSLLRELWTKELVNFKGRWHSVPDAGLNPLPTQRPIPIWFGGHAEAVLERAARLGDGWMPNYRTPADARPALEKLAGLRRAAGRLDRPFGIEARLPYADGNPDHWQAAVQDWEAAGATHLSFNTMGSGLTTPQQHLEAVRQIASGLKR